MLSNRRHFAVNMVFGAEDRILVENLYKFRGFGAKKVIREFPDKG